MATTIQVTENLRIGKYVEINGKRCEVEKVSFTQALTVKDGLEELFNALTERLIDDGVVKVVNSQYFWCDNDEPVVSDELYSDED
ncbi:TPA: hypothetical protein ACVU5P_004219 [Vibrio parahaemolyticus]